MRSETVQSGMSKNISDKKKILDSFFNQNEIVTNKISSMAMLVMGLLFCATAIADFFTKSWLGGPICRSIVFVTGLINVIAFCIVKTKKYEASWIKNFVINMVIFTSVAFMALYPLSSSFLFYGPLILSTLYFENKIVYRATAKCAISYGIIIWAHLILADHSSLIHGYHVTLGIEELMTFDDIMIDYFAPHIILFVVTGWLCSRASKRGKILLAREADVVAENRKMAEEFSAASKLQLSTLPAEEASYGDGKISIKAFMKPAKAVGGDFYDYFLKADKLVFMVGDVSDKGLPAALFMMKAKNALRAAFEVSEDFDRTIALANTLMYRDNRENMFVTAWIGCIDIHSGVGRYANCGHVTPFIRKADGNVTVLTNDPDLMLGIFENPDITSHDLRLESGESIVIYSDGLTDAVNAAGEAFGDQRLTETISGLKEKGPMAVDTLISVIDKFAADADQFDDMTILGVRMAEQALEGKI